MQRGSMSEEQDHLLSGTSSGSSTTSAARRELASQSTVQLRDSPEQQQAPREFAGPLLAAIRTARAAFTSSADASSSSPTGSSTGASPHARLLPHSRLLPQSRGHSSSSQPITPSRRGDNTSSSCKAQSHCKASSPRTPKDAAVCRICLEEASPEQQLDNPCGCTGTLQFAHAGCIQRWIDEKGSLQCEICGQSYKSSYRAPPSPPPPGAIPVLAPLGSFYLALDPEDVRAAAARQRIYGSETVLEDEPEWEDRHPLVRWAFSLVVFAMMMLVLHHGMVFEDADKGGSSSAGAGGMGPPGTNSTAPVPGGGAAGGGTDASIAAQIAVGEFMAFMVWIAVKALLIALPLCLAMRIALVAQQRELAMQQAYGLELGSTSFSDNGRRLVVRGRLLRTDAQRQQEQQQQQQQAPSAAAVGADVV